MQFDILTIFPDSFASYFNESIIKRAQLKKIVKIKIHDIRKNAVDKHKTVDDTPYGGGPGMLMKIEPIYKTLKKIKNIKTKKSILKAESKKQKIILLSPCGKKFTQKLAKEYSNLDQIVLISGHYEGVDSRIDEFIDEKISIGDYVLTNGNLPAMVIIDSITRLLPNVLGNKESFKQDSFYETDETEYPQYTKPEIFTYKKSKKNIKLKVPNILLSGNHKLIEKWKKENKK